MSNFDLSEIMKKRFRIKSTSIREFMAEFLGTFLLIIMGDGAVAQSVLTGEANGTFLSVNIGYAIAVLLAVLASGGVSGGHVNPAVSVAMAFWGRLPWAKVPIYMLGQYLGAFFASVILYSVYIDALNTFDGGVRSLATAGIWATYPGKVATVNGTVVDEYLTAGNGFGDQILGTAILLIAVCSITDHMNMGVPKPMQPFFVALAVLGLGISFGFNCGYAINPARDLSPRIFTLLAGWGNDPFTASTVDDVAWWWIPIVAPHLGAILGVFVYLCLVQLHHPPPEENALPNPHQTAIAMKEHPNSNTRL